jgi:hypothetical protein
MTQMVEEHKSLYRIKKMYKDDAKQCKECKAFWEKLEKDKEDHIRELTNLIQSHFPIDKKKFYYYSKGEKKSSDIKTTC